MDAIKKKEPHFKNCGNTNTNFDSHSGGGAVVTYTME